MGMDKLPTNPAPIAPKVTPTTAARPVCVCVCVCVSMGMDAPYFCNGTKSNQ